MISKNFVFCLCPSILAACGGGGSTEERNVAPLPSLETTSVNERAAVVAMQTTTNGTIIETSGILDRSADTVVLGGQQGNFDAGSQSVLFDDGSLMQIDPGSTSYVRMQTITNDSGSTFGILGVPSLDLPSGTMEYSALNGASVVVIVNDTDVLDLSGDTTVTIDFDSLLFDINLDNFSGTRYHGDGTQSASSDLFDLSIVGGSMAGGELSGGSIGMQVNQVTDLELGLSGNEVLVLDGAIFGPLGDEVGAAFSLDDSASGTVSITGVLVAD